MKKFIALLAGLYLLSAAALAETFEGKVAMKVTTSSNPPTDLTFSLKEGYSRIDTQMQGMSAGIIMDMSKQEMMILMNSQKMYMVRNLPKPPEKPSPAPGATNPAGALEKTGVSEKILGYDTTKYIYTTNGNTTEVWLTSQLGSFMGMGPAAAGGRRGAPAAASWDQGLIGTNSFPLRVVTTGKDGKETMRMDVTSIEKQTLPDTIFAPPPDFQKFDMSQMMRGMMPSGGTPPH